MMQCIAPVISNTEMLPETHLLWLDAPETAATAVPGQFVMVSCGEDTLLRRPISVHRADDGRLGLLFSIVGKGTRWLAQRQKGETVDIFGPLGNGFTVYPESANLLLIAGGIGIAPMRFLADTALANGKKVTLLMGARSADYLLPLTPTQGQFDRGLMASDFNVVNATDDGSEGFKGFVTGLIPAYANGVDQLFACGPVEMYRAMAANRDKYDKPVQLSLEIMMGCGIGVCYGCTIKTKSGLKQVCTDGPVFDMGEIDWEEFTWK